jgi:predicted ATP-dependent serine protease
VRRVSGLDVRLAEAARLGFRRLLVPEVCHRELGQRGGSGSSAGSGDCELIPIEEVGQAVDWLADHGVAAEAAGRR